MNDSTPQIENILTEMATLVRDALRENESIDQERVNQLAKALSSNGWERHNTDGPPLLIQIKDRAIEMLDHHPVHHKARLEALVGQFQKAFDQATRYETSVPEEERPLNDRNSYTSRPPHTGP